jgi:Mg-chelatase subunit ChlD
MCVRARALLLELEGEGGVPEEFANTCAELCGVLCLFDEPDQQVSRAWAALSSIPRMKTELFLSFVWYLKHHEPDLVQPLDAIQATLSWTGPRIAGLEHKNTVWKALSPPNKDVVFCLDVSGSMSNTVGNGSSRLKECQTAFTQLLDEGILKVGDRFGFKHFNHECNTLMPITEVSDASLKEVKAKVHALAVRGGTCFFSAIQSCLSDLQAANPIGFWTNEQWIVALTDGETAWNAPQEPANHNIIKDLLSRDNSKSRSLNLVCIVVGPNKQEHLINDLVASCHDSNRVIPLRVGTDDIAAAFLEVQEILSGGGLSEDL